MPETHKIVINTAPLIALVAALGDLMILQSLYTQVFVPFEVGQEILTGGVSGSFSENILIDILATPETLV